MKDITHFMEDKISKNKISKSKNIYPTVKYLPSSQVLNDPKGELFLPTSGTSTSPSLNFMNVIRLRTNKEVEDAQNFIKILGDPHGTWEDSGSGSDYWRKEAYTFLTAGLLHFLYVKEISQPLKNNQQLKKYLFGSDKKIYDLLKEMLTYEHDPEYQRQWKNIDGQSIKTCPTVAMTARNMLDMPESERGAIYFAAQAYLS